MGPNSIAGINRTRGLNENLAREILELHTLGVRTVYTQDDVIHFANVLTGWTQGGPIAIHGTNEPWSIGRAVSNGCIRVPNPVLRRLFKAVPAGTPVVIRR